MELFVASVRSEVILLFFLMKLPEQGSCKMNIFLEKKKTKPNQTTKPNEPNQLETKNSRFKNLNKSSGAQK